MMLGLGGGGQSSPPLKLAAGIGSNLSPVNPASLRNSAEKRLVAPSGTRLSLEPLPLVLRPLPETLPARLPRGCAQAFTIIPTKRQTPNDPHNP